MPSRELTYKLILSTSDAKRQARNIRSTLENELRSIQVGRLDISQIQAAVSQAHSLRMEFEQAARAAANVGSAAATIRTPTVSPTPQAPSAPAGGSGGFLAGLAGGAAAYLTMQGVQVVSNYVVETAKLDTQIRRTEKAFEFLSGGASQAEARLLALQNASNGTIDRFAAMGNINQIAALGLANTAQELEDLARAAKSVSTYSSQISDFGDAIAQLGLFAASSSFARADQLLIDASKLREKMKELKEEDASLTDQQAKLKASVELLNQTFGPLQDTVEAQASGAEQLSVAWSEFTNQKGAIGATFNTILSGIADTVDELSVISGFGSSRAILEVTKANAEAAKASAGLFFAPAGAERNAKAFEYTAKLLDKLTQGIEDGVPTALEYRQQVEAIAIAANRFGVVTDDQFRRLMEVDSAYKSALVSATRYNEEVGNPDQARQTMIFDQQPAIEQALASRAGKASGVVGIEAAIATYRQQKTLVDAAIQQLIDSGVSDQNEIAIRVSAITQQLLAPFDELEARASTIDLTAALGNFDQVGVALSNLNSGFTDFLPGVSAAREELTTLSVEMALTGQLSDEQAARLEYLSAVAYSVADGGSQLSAVVNDLGNDFLASNAYAAELVNQLFLTEAAYRNGAITGDIYAGVTATLTGQLLTLAQGAGIATGAIYALNSAQADMASPAGLAIGGSIANRIQSTQQSSAREQNRREQERYNRDLARSQERSAGRAGKLLEDGAKKANQELKSALDKVPGLFSTTQVTEQDMRDAELGVYQEKADEYLRRLRDEVQNGRDWEDVSIEEARAGLERAGLEVGETAEQTLMLLERAMNDSSLYSAVENIPIFINEEAVKLTQELQNKSEEGRKNIYAYFGVQVDEAVGAATGGGGGGAAIEVKPPEFIDIDPLTDGLQTGLDDVVARTGDAVQTALQNAPNAFFDPASLFGAGDKSTGAMGPAAKPTVTVTADASAQAWGPVVSGAQPAQIALSPTIDTTSIQAQLDAIKAPTLTATITLPDDAGQQLALDMGNQLGKQANVLIGHGTVMGQALISGMSAALSVDAEGNATIDFAGFVGNNLNASADTFIAQGRGIASLLKQGVTEGMQPVEGSSGFAVQIAGITLADGVRAPDVSVLGKIDKFAIDQTALYDAKVTIPVELAMPQQQTNADGSQGANAITPIITDINTQIRTQSENIKNQGITIAQILMAGLLAHFRGGQQSGSEQAATPLADALMTNVSAQFGATQNMFYAIGFGPAGAVESGFKGYAYTGLSSGLLDALTNGIRADAENYMQRGATIAGYVQAGINTQFNSETGVRSAIAAGAAWGNAFMSGVFDALNSGGFVDQITTTVIDGITGELEQP